MHLLLMVDARHNEMDKAIAWLARRNYPHISAGRSDFGVKVNELRLLNVIFPAEWKDALMKDIRYFFKNDDRQKAVQGHFLVKKALGKVNMEQIDLEAYGNMKKPLTSEVGKIDFFSYMFPLGILHDNYVKEGEQHGHFRIGMEKL